MSQNLKPTLPEIFPTGEVLVENEEHQYKTYQSDSGAILEEREYTLNKAPIREIVEVSGVSNNDSITFEKGSDYELSADNERLVWKDDPADRPDAGSLFRVTYRSESIISRYIDSGEKELTEVENELDRIVESKFVDQAEGQELDELGKLFGELGKRNGRADQEYRIYLKSFVQSVVSRGTVNGIKLAISTATDVPIDDIEINENFERNEYQVNVIAATPVDINLLERVAEIADPSGVKQARSRFKVPPDVTTIADSTDFSEGQNITDSMVVSDGAVTIDPNNFDISETLFADDSVTTNQVSITAFEWEEDSTGQTEWDFFEWRSS
jgi:hypothetical protein